jgi:acyl carrier protein
VGRTSPTPREFISPLAMPNDSLGMLDLIITIEDEFDIVITQAEAAEITSMEELIILVDKKVE